ncbi:T9SS type A sorting domain-containing protein [Paucihalobacter ruber]|uniref:T9SS type A sorting domain-containing protein n=1 Tax=Paucihalobacter ruber TaxID=2567861 RepID=A0A506PGE2_9FLAO|nr:T9SS type A sorting domain-containing protein [Paucihalobacter ruber]TPV32485.1 T9SS type A sorting domain-containing protein [Paucihalobacter ruber]
MKKIALCFLTAVTCLGVYAQLHVQGNHFVFANNVELFVQNEVNLKDEQSTLYLRNGAQLLQDDNVGNRGMGELSIQQTGTVNQFAYNYWCSPIGASSMAATNEPFRVDLIHESTGLISSNNVPFTTALDGTPSPGLTISSRWLYTFTTSNQYNDWIYVGSSLPIAPGLGFTMKGFGENAPIEQVYDFRGKPNNGDVQNDVLAGNFTLIGNPYPSALDAALFVNDPANLNTISGELYFWEQEEGADSHFIADYVGGYGILTYGPAPDYLENFVNAPFFTYDGSGNVVTGSPPIPPTPVGFGIKIARRYQPIGQGFLVRGSNNGIVTVKNEHRAFVQEGADSFFFRSTEVETPEENSPFYQVPEDYKRFRINIDFNDLYTRQLLHNFHHTATDGFDRGLEGHRPGGPASDAYWTLDDNKFVIQAHDYRESLRIPIEVNAENNQPLRFRIVDIQNFEDRQPIYLFDSKYDVYVNLKKQDYNINIAAGTYSNRFEITFNRGTLSNDEFITSNFRVVQDNSNANLLLMNPTLLDLEHFSLIDISGKQVITKSQLGAQSEYNFDTAKLSDGVYIASIKSTSGNSLSKKVIIKN